MRSIYEYSKEYYSFLPHGQEREKGIRRAIDAALEQNDYRSALDLYYEFFDEAVFHDDGYEGLILLPEYTALFEAHPEMWNDYSHNLMIVYKWLSDDYSHFYQISREQIESMLDKYSSLCDRFNYNKRTYYQAVYSVIKDIGEDERVSGLTLRQAHELYLKCKRDQLSDCRACELNALIEHTLFVEDDPGKALTLAKPLFKGELSCSEVPHITYASFAYCFLKKGFAKEAEAFADKAWRLIARSFADSTSLADYEGDIILTYAYSSTKKGLAVLKWTLPVCWNMKNGVSMWRYYFGFYHLMLRLEQEGVESVALTLPDKDADCYTETNRYTPTALKDYAYKRLKFLEEKFNARNGNTVYTQRLQETFTPAEKE